MCVRERAWYNWIKKDVRIDFFRETWIQDAVIAVNYLLFTWCSKCPLTQQIHTACIWWYWILLLLKALLLSHSQRDNIANNAMYKWITLYTEFAFHLEANVHGGEWSMKKKNRYTSPTTAETIAKDSTIASWFSVGRWLLLLMLLSAGFIYLFIFLLYFFGLYGTNIMSVSHTQPRMSMDKKSLLKYLWLRFFLFEWCQHDFYLMLFGAFLMAMWRVKKVNLSFELFIQWNVNMNMSLETEIEWKEKGKYWWVNFYIYFSWDLL